MIFGESSENQLTNNHSPCKSRSENNGVFKPQADTVRANPSEGHLLIFGEWEETIAETIKDNPRRNRRKVRGVRRQHTKRMKRSGGLKHRHGHRSRKNKSF